jgi:hypothetical protein
MLISEDEGLVYVLGSRKIFQYDGDYFDWLYLPMGWLPNLRCQDVAVLPDHWVLRDFVEFLQETLFDFVPEVIWVPVRYLLDDAIMESPEVLDQLRVLANQGKVFVPFDGTTIEFASWFGLLKNARLLGETMEWGSRFATKEWLHPWANAPGNSSIAQTLGFPVLDGFNAATNHDLVLAWELMRRAPAIIKPLRSSFGDGLVVLAEKSESEVSGFLQEYNFPHGPVALERFVQIDQDALGEVSWSTHYVGSSVFGPPTRQLISGRTSIGNITPAEFSPKTVRDLNEVTLAAVNALKPSGIGGFNGPFVKGRPYLTDPNVGRITCVCPILLFRELYCPNSVTLNRRLGKPTMSMHLAHQRLVDAGLAFNVQTGTGVAIQGWIPSAWSQIFCAGESEQAVLEIYQQAVQILIH